MEPLEVKYGLPREVAFCTKCVISNQRPSSTVEFKNNRATDDHKETIVFGDDGVCDACRFAEYKETNIDWDERRTDLMKLCDRYRKTDGSYDCLVPGSGGKDSAYTAHMLKHAFGMNPLTVTWAPHLYTDIGWKNMTAWSHEGGFDNVLFTPNGHVHRLVTRMAFENLVHPFQPFIIGQKLIAPKFALMYNIPLIFYGENQAEYGNNIKDNDSPTMREEFFAYDADVDSLFLGGVSARELIEKHNIPRGELNPYLPAPSEKIKQLGVQVHYLGYYLKWDPQECFYYAVKHTGFTPNYERTEGSWSKYSSIDDRIDPFHYYTTLIKFGLGRATYDASQEIRNHKITREEGVALVRRFDAEFPKKYFKEFLEYTGITEERFWDVIDVARSPHLWTKESGKWKLRTQAH